MIGIKSEFNEGRAAMAHEDEIAGSIEDGKLSLRWAGIEPDIPVSVSVESGEGSDAVQHELYAGALSTVRFWPEEPPTEAVPGGFRRE
ncbi:hypothetical protein [Actinoalloteichus hymeniacidonis]|uniref:Uncharacterized protein n=1 Tax=Actinoalloteichus hymeniacidonis TaxID=340345 RepID=A0AAC9HQS0_9PSEU|nr:hypothetical protein [Actinoalloteichus hymeniacidonis]AOS63536.1 hypothetical protein TL08_13610 [Actinoalloteichus hymeniacidonis]MBB5908419.1 hypothetical protein [Actinoalloteichus hymeniacidonis]